MMKSSKNNHFNTVTSQFVIVQISTSFLSGLKLNGLRKRKMQRDDEMEKRKERQRLSVKQRSSYILFARRNDVYTQCNGTNG